MLSDQCIIVLTFLLSAKVNAISSVDKAAAQAEETKANAFRFLDLPGELRNEIYELCTKCETPVAMQLMHGSDDEDITIITRLSHPQIAQVNKQLRRESLDIFYSVNTFRTTVNLVVTHDLVALSQYLERVGEENCRPIKSIQVSLYRWEFVSLEAMTAWVLFQSKPPGCLPKQTAFTFHDSNLVQPRWRPHTAPTFEFVVPMMEGLTALGRALTTKENLRPLIVKKKIMEWLESNEHPELEATKKMIRSMVLKPMRLR